jgi:Na+/melibiose symporter-like transporter
MTGLPFAGCALAFLALLTYPLHGKQLADVKAQLAQRHTQAN